MMLCPRCHVELKWGIAIDSHTDPDAKYIAPQGRFTAKDVELVDVLKCPKCGYSDDGATVNPVDFV
jgi:Zn-finger nucleic acid-binding protein